VTTVTHCGIIKAPLQTSTQLLKRIFPSATLFYIEPG